MTLPYKDGFVSLEEVRLSPSKSDPRLSGGEDDSLILQDYDAAISDAFDANFYRARYRDVREAGIDPLSHYLTYGWREDRDPRADLDGAYYRRKYLSTGLGISPLEHYVRKGRALDLPLSGDDEVRRFGDLIRATGIDLPHEEKDVFHRFVVPLFAPEDYRQRTGIAPDIPEGQLMARYLATGLTEGVPPGPLFDAEFYRAEAERLGFPPIREIGGPFLHWLGHGLPARVVPLSIFSEATYLALNRDVEKFEGWLFEHFLRFGLRENRRFLSSVYLAQGVTQALQPSAPSRNEVFLSRVAQFPSLAARIRDMEDFLASDTFSELLRHATDIEPLIAQHSGDPFRLLPPWHDENYANYREVRDLIPCDRADRVILMPFCKMGGSDYTAGALARAAGPGQRTVILRTEQSDWARPDWFPGDIISVDLSTPLKLLPPAHSRRVLYEILRDLRPRHVYNCNSRLAFETFEEYGARLSRLMALHAYYFCSDLSPEGVEKGYPVQHFAQVLPHIATAICDSRFLADRLTGRFALPPPMRDRLLVLRTPVRAVPPEPVVRRQLDTSGTRIRPVLLWGGRLDRQKRFDLLLEIARRMPEVEIRCWGRAVLDPPPETENLPENVSLHPPFTTLEDLPMSDSDGWLYTSAWDGLPNTLVEAGAWGMPVVASAVGGVPELVDETTGWAVAQNDDPDAYVAAIREMLSNPEERMRRAERLRARVLERHAPEQYAAEIARLEGRADE